MTVLLLFIAAALFSAIYKLDFVKMDKMYGTESLTSNGGAKDYEDDFQMDKV